MLHIFERSFTI